MSSYGYYNLFSFCKIISAPKLPATTLANSCYLYMFYGCTSLKEIYCNARYFLGTTVITGTIDTYLLQNVPNTTVCIFHNNPAWSGPTSRGTNTIPSNWQIVDWVQTLPS